MLLLSSDFFQHISKYQAVFSQIEYFLRDDKLTFSIIQLPPPPCAPSPPGSDATVISADYILLCFDTAENGRE